MMFIPFWYIKLTAGHFKKDVAAELETALSIITTAYLRSEDFLTAVEENIGYLNQPVCSVFQSFLTRVKHGRAARRRRPATRTSSPRWVSASFDSPMR